jgi:hypothetical protein
MNKVSGQPPRADGLGRIFSTKLLRKTIVVALISFGAAAGVASVSAVAVEKLSGTPVTDVAQHGPTSIGARATGVAVKGVTSIGTWVVPHDETTAPVVPTSGGASVGAGGFNAVSCPSTNECVAVGGDGNLDAVASTSSDGGNTWIQGTLSENEPELNAVDCSSVVHCTAVGNGAAALSTDSGEQWTSISIPTDNTTLLSVSCPSTSLCVSAGVSPGTAGPYAGEVLLSTNGGAAWTESTLPASAGAIGSVACPTTKFCVAVGASILVSTNGGTTWSERTVAGGMGVLRSVACSSATTCVAIGPNPGIAQNAAAAAFEVVTTNGGASWSSVATPAGSATLDVVACSLGTCDAAGSTFNGLPAPYLSGTSAGGSWVANSNVPSSLTAVSGLTCMSATSCVFVGRAGSSPVSVTTGSGSGVDSPVGSLVRAQKGVSR